MKHTNAFPLCFKISVVKFYYNNPNIIIKDILHIFSISNGSLFNWINLYSSNQLTEKKKYFKKPLFSQDIFDYIRNFVIKKCTFDYKYLIRNIKRVFNINIAKSTIYKILKKLNITYKKFSKRFIMTNKKRFMQKKNDFIKFVKNINHNDIISIDETSIDTHICSKYGWNYKGHKINKTAFVGYKRRVSLLCAISNKKILYYTIINGSADSIIFSKFIKDMIEKHKLNHKYLLLDNASIHHAKNLKTYIETTTCKILYNVPYYPEFNPIENVFSKIKLFMRTKNNESLVSLKNNIVKSFKLFKVRNIKNYYKNSLTFI
jgi:transposase